MQKLSIAAAAAILLSTTAVYAAPITVTGTYSVAVSNQKLNGNNTAAGNGPTTTDGLSSPFTEMLNLGVATSPTTFIDVTPSGNGSLTPSNSSFTNTVTALVTVTFNFTLPTIEGPLTDTANFSATYHHVPGQDTDFINWTSSPLVVDFADGAVLDITLNNDSDWTLNPTISFDLTQDPTPPVPEPASIALLGAGLVGFGALRRRKKSV